MTTLRQMTEQEFIAWFAHSIPSYAAEKVAAGQWTAEESEALSRTQHAEMLPQGLSTVGHHFFCIEAPDGQNVGMLWFAVRSQCGHSIAYVYQVEIYPAHQRKGHARAAFAALEAEVRSLGLNGIALHVFGHNAGARVLYEGLGFETTNIQMYKGIDSAP